MKARNKMFLLFLVVIAILSCVQSTLNPVEYVNILGGTDRPWSFNTWAPITDNDPTWPGWWFHPSDRRYFGMRVTHQPSPWIRDYGNFIVKASLPGAQANDPMDFSGYSPKKSTFQPNLFKTSLYAYSTAEETMDLAFTSSSHGAVMKVKFPTAVHSSADNAFVQTRRVSITLNGNGDQSNVTSTLLSDGTLSISGFTTANSGGVSVNFAHYFVLGIYRGENGDKPVTATPLKTHADSRWAYVDFAAEDGIHDQLTLRIGTSLISLEQAVLNMGTEVGTQFTFDQLVQQSQDEWNTVLSRASVEDVGKSYSEEQSKAMLTTFYSCMYRASLFPRQLTETNKAGQLVHWSPYDGNVHDGYLSTDSGFWDAYSTVYPLHSLLNREQLGVQLQGWLNAYKEGGWLPKWASPGYRGSMVGTMGDVTLADAIVKKIPNFDMKVAYEAIRKDAFEVPPERVEGVGRVCLEGYLKYGYIPVGASMTTGGTCSEVVSRTLNYLQSDYAIARAADSLGFRDDAVVLDRRAGNFSAQFEANTGFFRAREIVTQKFVEPFDQFAWGGVYTEAGPWQYKFYVPYDAKGLAAVYASAGKDVCDDLQKAQTMASTFHVGSYGSEIHEQTEMPDTCWGQYEHNNQPVHHMLYMFGAVDESGYSGACAAKGQYWLRKAMTQLYKPGNNMFAGDEDNGQMAAWYLLSSLGMYSLSPGFSDYVFGSPLFSKVTVNIGDTAADNSKLLTIVALNNTAANVYVQSVAWNGQTLTNTNSIAYTRLMQGGQLTFTMGPAPATGGL